MHADWDTAITDHLTWARAGGRSPDTLRLRRAYLVRLARQHPDGPWSATLDSLAAWVADPHWGAEARKSARAACRVFYGWAADTGRIQDDPARRLPAVRIPRRAPRPAPEAITSQALVDADERGQLMVLLARLAGLRRSEIARLHTRDLEGDSIRVRGKGGVVRVIPLHPDLLVRLQQIPEGYVFPGREDGHLSRGHVGVVLSRLLGPGWSGHTLRHAAATAWYGVDRDLLAVRDLLGHASVATTQIYTAMPDDARRSAVMGAPLPGRHGRAPGERRAS